MGAKNLVVKLDEFGVGEIIFDGKNIGDQVTRLDISVTPERGPLATITFCNVKIEGNIDIRTNQITYRMGNFELSEKDKEGEKGGGDNG